MEVVIIQSLKGLTWLVTNSQGEPKINSFSFFFSLFFIIIILVNDTAYVYMYIIITIISLTYTLHGVHFM